jgi:hypothetical protein
MFESFSEGKLIVVPLLILFDALGIELENTLLYPVDTRLLSRYLALKLGKKPPP